MTHTHDAAIAAAQLAADGIEWWCPPAYLRACVLAALTEHERMLCERWRAEAANVDRGRREVWR